MAGNHQRTIERKFSAKRSSRYLTKTGEILTLGDTDKLKSENSTNKDNCLCHCRLHSLPR